MDTNNEAEILAKALTPASLFDDDYGKFTAERAQLLVETARSLIA